MKFRKVEIATAKIRGLGDLPYYFEHRCFYAWSITFEDLSSLSVNNLPFIKVGDTYEEAEVLCNKIKRNFSKANIHDGNRVAVIFKKDGQVLAIGKIGEDVWIDVTDNFSKKTFKELKIKVTSLRVY